MIQFNLLPDVKIEYMKARRSRRLVIVIAVLAVAISLALLISVLSVAGLQKKHLKDLNNDIGSDSSTLQKKPQIDKILTVQNQLESIGKLHDGKPAVTRLFDYLNQVTPAQADITTLSTDFTQGKNTLVITGTADALSTVNQYVDTLKFTTYSVGTGKDAKKTKAFSNVVLSSFGLTTSSSTTTPGSTPPTAKKASYTISLVYDPTIFNITKTIKLDVPSQITTRSEIDQPSELFSTPATSVVPVTNNPTTTGGTR